MKLAALVLILGVSGIAQQPAPRTAARPAQTGPTLAQAEAVWRAARTTDDFKAALRVFDALIAAHPDNAEYQVREGDLFFERFSPDEAEKNYEAALEIDPKNVKAYLGLAEVYADDFSSNAAASAAKALEIDPKAFHAHEILARVALEDDQRTEAAKEADAALAIQPDALQAIAIHVTIDLLEDKQSPWLPKLGNRARGYEMIAKYLVINRRYEDGILYYRKAIEIDPELWSAHSQLGVNLMRMGREQEARSELEIAYNNYYRDAETPNALKLMDSYKDFVTFTTPRTVIKLNKKEADVLHPYVQEVLDHAMAVYEKKYQFKIDRPIQVEVYPLHGDFEVRVMGLPGMGGILGVTFDNVVAMDSPSGRPPGEFHWASTLWHELSHVYILSLTNERTPRWFTEGLAVHEETATYPDWGDRLGPHIITALRDKKLLPIADMDRGFVHPSFPEQVVVSYYQAGKICDYIGARWGESKLLDMARAFAKNRPTLDVIREVLGIEPDQFDHDFLAALDKETGKAVAGFADWTKGMREVNQLAKDGNIDEVLKQAPALESVYPDFVEAGNTYELISTACLKKGDKACAIAELTKYSAIGGRDAVTIKELATLLDEAGKKKEAAAALQRLNYIYPLDAELHERLGNLYLDTNNAGAAVTEFQALVGLHPMDVAGSHYNLAKAYEAVGQNDKAREEAVTALEAAPEYRPAQKLLLEVSK